MSSPTTTDHRDSDRELAEVIEFAQKAKATEERIIAEVRRGMDPVEAHEKVNYDNMLKA